MTLPRTEVGTGLLTELASFEELLRTLADDELDVPTRCEGWTVRDVAAHVVGTHADIAAGRLDGLGTPEVTQREVEERQGRSADELADELAGARKVAADVLATFDDAAWEGPSPGTYDGTLGSAVEALWYDAFVHADDIRAALWRPTVLGPGLKASVAHIAELLDKKGWGPATLALDGQPRYDVNGGGREITGDAWQFVLAAVGRIDPAPLGLDETVNVYA